MLLNILPSVPISMFKQKFVLMLIKELLFVTIIVTQIHLRENIKVLCKKAYKKLLYMWICACASFSSLPRQKMGNVSLKIDTCKRNIALADSHPAFLEQRWKQRKSEDMCTVSFSFLPVLYFLLYANNA